MPGWLAVAVACLIVAASVARRVQVFLWVASARSAGERVKRRSAALKMRRLEQGGKRR